MPRVCPCCEKATTFTSLYEGRFKHNDAYIEVPDLECNRCPECDGVTIMAHQARANQQRIREAKEGLK